MRAPAPGVLEGALLVTPPGAYLAQVQRLPPGTRPDRRVSRAQVVGVEPLCGAGLSVHPTSEGAGIAIVQPSGLANALLVARPQCHLSIQDPLQERKAPPSLRRRAESTKHPGTRRMLRIRHEQRRALQPVEHQGGWLPRANPELAIGAEAEWEVEHLHPGRRDQVGGHLARSDLQRRGMAVRHMAKGQKDRE